MCADFVLASTGYLVPHAPWSQTRKLAVSRVALRLLRLGQGKLPVAPASFQRLTTAQKELRSDTAGLSFLKLLIRNSTVIPASPDSTSESVWLCVLQVTLNSLEGPHA